MADQTPPSTAARRFDNGAGGFGKGYRVFNGQLAQGNLFLKANGLGDLIALCDEALIEIGNRVWFDANSNGRQDRAQRLGEHRRRPG